MAGDGAANEWLHACARLDSDLADDTVVDDDEGPSSGDDDTPWLPVLEAEDRALVRQYMLANRCPEAGAQSIDDWPVSELGHLLVAARLWKVPRRNALPSEPSSTTNSMSSKPGVLRTRGRAGSPVPRPGAGPAGARPGQQHMVLTGREARRSRTGNHLQGNPGLDVERHIREVAAEGGFAIRQSHWDRASNRLFIDLYHLEAEAWWDRGDASGLAHVPPDGTVHQSKRSYRALYSFQRAAINAAYGNQRMQPEVPTAAPNAEPLDVLRARPLVDKEFGRS